MWKAERALFFRPVLPNRKKWNAGENLSRTTDSVCVCFYIVLLCPGCVFDSLTEDGNSRWCLEEGDLMMLFNSFLPFACEVTLPEAEWAAEMGGGEKNIANVTHTLLWVNRPSVWERRLLCTHPPDRSLPLPWQNFHLLWPAEIVCFFSLSLIPPSWLSMFVFVLLIQADGAAHKRIYSWWL